MIFALIPVKRLALAKQRLAGVLNAEGRAALTLAMLADVLSALSRVEELDRVAVVGSDASVAETAERYSAQFIPEPLGTRGLNDAIQAAIEAVAGPGDAALILPADLPTIKREDVQRLIQEAPTPGIAVVRAVDGGTNALLLRPAGVITPAFGRGSAHRHLVRALKAGVAACEMVLPSLVHDLDNPADLRWAAEALTLGEKTRALLSNADRLFTPSQYPRSGTGKGG